MKPPVRRLTEAQRKQRALYKAQAANPPKPRVGVPAGVAFALHRATGLGVRR